MENEKRALSLLGIAMRAGQVTSGDSMCEREVRAGRAALVLLDAGVSANTRGKYAAMCAHHRVPLAVISADALGRAIGKDNRMVAALPKGTFAEKIWTSLSSDNEIP